MAASKIDYGSPIPPYQQIAADIIRDINAGIYEVDRPIPSQPTLVDRYGVALRTVQRTIRHLVELGYVYTVPKRGTYVKARKAATES
ncbi:winged helix-turn-helix domain-containing protein [Streptomyces roseoverticillatus]|uniref:GntR family transcriptional regulator n=1 Tax=Streptomyces roseoverticillatus TaxID=66429 RepID=UPI0004C255DD|nr:winged helix-turn-helix domain-containing protein [Streptomyces roseoverticillatus]